MKVEQLMSREVVTAAPETTLKEVARLLTQRRISGLPVCDAEGRVLGVVSEADILRKEQGPAPKHGGRIGRWFGRGDGEAERLGARTAGEAMSSPAITLGPTATVAEAARLMVSRSVNRLPVLDGERLVGIVSRADLVRAFHRSDAEIEQEIADDVLLHTLWVSPREVRISVVDGVVELEGRLDNRTEAELVVAYVRRIPGVVDVRPALTWRIDDRARGVGDERLPRRL